MRQFLALAAIGVAATTLMLATPGTSEARGGHSHGGHGGHHHGSYSHYHRGYYYGGRGYYRVGLFGRTRYYRNTCCVPVNNCCCWTGYQTGQWMQHETDKAYFGYYVNGVQVAGYNQKTGAYRTYDAATDTWSQPLVPPWLQGMAVN